MSTERSSQQVYSPRRSSPIRCRLIFVLLAGDVNGHRLNESADRRYTTVLHDDSCTPLRFGVPEPLIASAHGRWARGRVAAAGAAAPTQIRLPAARTPVPATAGVSIMPDISREQLRAFARDGYIVVSQVVSFG